MPLPQFNNNYQHSFEPIHKNLYEVSLISQCNEIKALVKKFKITNDLLTLDIHNSIKYGYLDIKESKVALLSCHDRKGHIIKFEIFEMENLTYEYEFSIEIDDISTIQLSFKINNYKLLNQDELLEKDKVVKSFLRNHKLDILLE